MENKITKSLILIIVAFIFLRCSTDDNGENLSSQPEEHIGVFLDSPVEGLFYESESFSGYTDAKGQFSYAEGEQIVFFVGDIKIGSAVGQEEITPISIASTSDATLESKEVKNIAAFLQTLDIDGDPENGIKIEQTVVDALEMDTVNFSGSITQVIGEIVNDVNQRTGIDLNPVYPEEAATHLAASLNTSYEPDDLLFTDFLPTIESWNIYAKPYLPNTASIWIHKTDENGNPSQSIQYEKHPYRIVRTYTYSNYNEFNLPKNIETQYYNYGEPGNKAMNQVTYNLEGQLSSWSNANSSNWKYDLEKNEDGSIKAISSYFNSNLAHKNVFIYNESGNLIKEIRYKNESESSVIYEHSYTYTEFGEMETLSMLFNNEQALEYLWEYSYDENNVLIERHRETVDLLGRDRTDTYFYNEEERLERLLIKVGDYVSDYVEFYPNGDPKKAETTYQGFLYEIVIWDENGYSEWKIIEEDTGNYRIEYKDQDENILKTEYYDSQGNLISIKE
ncbi:hypothetical protein SAMN05444483_12221 [Salegentibacter echinorum]|uniref:Uncharacterized protein n=1 Tax=Salegentibacter echinorum TaxID=1073325 RepID=A0A1M5LUQ5_SALEC|nr:hypothetical protein [Salegentibacter echinorum]SHG68787.1 hypothetical protein SAMN05444483_12221 [Salegentibacter echinorum]